MENAFSIRRMTEQDIPAVVALQRLSLGEGNIPRTEAFWKWKHQDNPFGPSPVLLAFDGSTLVGLRALMRWKWEEGEKTYQCLRAVDTATHPHYQGRGLFRALTLQLIKELEEEGFDFIFNTPNKKSMPGYLKMGWQEAGRIPVRLGLGKVNAIWATKELPSEPPHAYRLEEVNWDDLEELFTGWNRHQVSEKLQTPLSASFMKWRYLEIPEINYFGGLFRDKGWVWLIGRMKSTLGRRELRIVELYGTDEVLAKRCLQNLRDYYNPVFISLADHNPGGLLNKFGFKLKIGPKLVLRKINSLPEEFHDTKHWNASLGNFELF
jgi:GNAT superfamily N-acetyltransferase